MKPTSVTPLILLVISLNHDEKAPRYTLLMSLLPRWIGLITIACAESNARIRVDSSRNARPQFDDAGIRDQSN